METDAKRAAIYCRVSTKGQEEEGTSLETQEAACRDYAAKHGYAVVEAHVYREVYSRMELWERPLLTNLREAVRRHAVDVVITLCIDRLSGEPIHQAVLIAEADHAGVPILFVQEPLDSSPEGTLIRFVRGYAAQIEHAKIRERTMRGKLAKVMGGRMLGAGRPKYGHRWVYEPPRTPGGKPRRVALEPNPATAPIMQRMYREVLQGYSLRQIAARLEQDGVPPMTPQAKRWYYWNLSRLLSDPGYCGRATAMRWQTVPKKGQKERFPRERPLEEQIPLPEGTVPALVDVATWEAVQERLALNKKERRRPSKHPDVAIVRGGLARCAYCGHALAVDHRGRKVPGDSPRQPYYACKNQAPEHRAYPVHPAVSVEVLDEAVWDKVMATLTKDEIIEAELERMQREDPTGADLEGVEREIATVEKKRRNLLAQLEDLDAEAAEAVRRRLSELGAQHKALIAERERVLGRRAAWQAAHTRLAELDAWRRQVASKLQNADYEKRRWAVEALGIKVRVWGLGHEPRWEITASLPLGNPDPEGGDTITVSHLRSLDTIFLRWTDSDDQHASVAAEPAQVV